MLAGNQFFAVRAVAVHCPAPSNNTLLNRRVATTIPSALITLAILFFSVSVALAQQRIEESQLVPVEKSPGRLVELRGADYNAFTTVPRRDLEARSSDELRGRTAFFNVTYVGFSQPAMNAFQYAVNIWSSLIESSQTIKVEAKWTPLAPDTIGSASSTSRFTNFPGAPVPNRAFPSALADALGKGDHEPDNFDINANFNSTLTNWYFGTDGLTPAGQTDMVTVVLHELGHGLGFSGSMRVDDGMGPDECHGIAGIGCYGRGAASRLDIFDIYPETFGGLLLINHQQDSVELGNALTGGNIFFDSPGANGANGGARPKLWAPNPADGGSTYSHLDEMAFPPGNPDSLMTPALGMAEAIQDPGDITLCMFEDMGWRTAAGCQGGGLIGPTVLHNQSAYCSGFTNIISQFFTDFGVGVQAADDFVVPTEESWSIETLWAFGLYIGIDWTDSANITIYKTELHDFQPATPGEIVCSFPAQIPRGGGQSGLFVFDLPSPCNLEEGTYWLEVQAIMALDPGPGQNQWNWIQSPNTHNGDEYEWQDVNDLFGTGCTSWAPGQATCGLGTVFDHDLCFAFESSPGEPSEIFSNGFESGDTLRWSSTQ